MKYFTDIEKVRFEGKDSDNMFAYRYYDKDRTVLGKPMKDHLKFAVAYWHTMTDMGTDPFGAPIHQRDWVVEDPMQTSINRVHGMFDILKVLDLEYFCFHDVDIAPKGNSMEEFFANIDTITDLIKEKMDETEIKVLWNTANMFSDPIYVNGAASSPNSHVFASTAAQIKKGLDIAKKLNSSNYVFWGGREGYESLLNTNTKFEQSNIARMFKLALDYADKIGYEGQFLIEPKPMEPTKHQYDYDAATTILFLKTYGLEDKFKLNLEGNHATLAGHTFEHEIRVAADHNMLGSLDANQGDLLLGWDVDEFPTNLLDTTLAMVEVINAGGLGKGGINFDAKVRRSSFEMKDLVLAHIAGIDTYARALLSAEKLIESKFFENLKEERYISFENNLGVKILEDDVTLESLSQFALNDEAIVNESSHLEYVKSRINDFIY